MRSVLLAVVVVACGPSVAERRAVCEARVVALEARLREMHEPVPPRAVPPGFEPAVAEGPDPSGLRPIVTLGLGAWIALDGRALDREGLAQDVDTLRRNWAILHPREPYDGGLLVWADRRLTLAEVHAATSLVDPAPDLWLLAESPVPVLAPARCPPAHESLCRDLADVSRPSERPAILAAAWREAVGSCWELQTLSASIANADATERGLRLRDGVPGALRACECVGGGLDVEAVAYLTDAVLGLSEPRVAMRGLGAPASTDATTTVEAFFPGAP